MNPLTPDSPATMGPSEHPTRPSLKRTLGFALCLAVSLGLSDALAPVALAFPPAPHHTLFGQVRTQFGDPLNVQPADVYMETPGGAILHTALSSDPEPGVNYRLDVPMDSGTAADLYQPTALRPFHQFRLKVLIGQTSYLPIEMAGTFAQIGLPGKQTRLNLTLGVDSDGDGLPDAWEQSLIAIYGGTLADIRPDADADGDGISNLAEYLAGTYAFDPEDGFRLLVIDHGNRSTPASMEFLALRGRTYTVESSTNLTHWTRTSFRIVNAGIAGSLQERYSATDIRSLRIEVPPDATATNRYFRALVQ